MSRGTRDLRNREQAALADLVAMHLGPLRGESLTYRHIAELLGISFQRVQQLERSAIETMQLRARWER